MEPVELIGPGPWLDESLTSFRLFFAENSDQTKGVFALIGNAPLVPVAWTVRIWQPRKTRVSMG